MPILMGLYMSLKYPSSHGITEYPHFLWFDLTQPDLIMTIIAAIMYFVQPLVNSIHYPKIKENILLYDGIFTDIHNICVSTFCCSFGLILEYKRCFLIVQCILLTLIIRKWHYMKLKTQTKIRAK